MGAIGPPWVNSINGEQGRIREYAGKVQEPAPGFQEKQWELPMGLPMAQKFWPYEVKDMGPFGPRAKFGPNLDKGLSKFGPNLDKGLSRIL